MSIEAPAAARHEKVFAVVSPLMLISNDHIRAARSRIQPYVRETPLLTFDALSRLTHRNVLIKCESLQKTGSFKIRGAANCLLQNLDRAKQSGVITASAGNHAQGVAAMSKQLGVHATIAMPVWTPPIKVQNTESLGATVELVGNVYDESFEYASELAKSKGFVFIHPFHDANVIAGQGTIGLELLENPAFENMEAVVVPVGGGGLLTGIATALRAQKPKIKIYGVGVKNAPASWKSFHEKQLTEVPVKFTLAEGVAQKRPDQTMLTLLRERIDDFFSISEESVAHAIALLAEHGKMVVEGAGALPVAALLEDLIPEKNVALVLSGGNIDLPALSQVLQRGLVEQGRFVRLVITILDRPGGLAAMTQILAEKGANILQVFHQRASLKTSFGEAEAEVDLETRGRKHTDQICEALKERGFRVRREA